MDSLREVVLQKVVELELFHTYAIVNGERVPTYVLEGYDREMMEAEGSIHIVYVHDCLRQYYQQHKENIDDTVDEALWNAIEKQERFRREGA